MNGIDRVAVVGMGALGLLFGRCIAEYLGPEKFCFLMDNARFARHRDEPCFINGVEMRFQICPEGQITPADLVIVAVKYGGLRGATALMRPAVGKHTTIISLLNGISSEEIIAEAFGREQIIDCVAIGMDAMREGNRLSFQNAGRLQIGIKSPDQEGRLRALEDFFRRAAVPFETVPDITRAMWYKFMINVGVNQTCMVYDTTYSGATAPGGKAREDMTAAMREVMRLAEAEGIALTEDDLASDLRLLMSLDPDGYPSMRQDALAGRRSEVELFAGTVIKLAEKHGLEVPVNRRYYESIMSMESAFQS